MARPHSPVTVAVRAALHARGSMPTTWRDVAHELASQGVINAAAPSELRLVRKTVFNLAERGEVQAVARVASPGSRRPMTGWVACQSAAPYRARIDGVTPVAQALSHVMQAWMA